MPHFIVDCAENVRILASEDAILQAVHTAANGTGLFSIGGD